MIIARQFHWEMGHRLPFHTAGCANIHGHSYKLWVEIDGPCDANGMLMDYGEMKRRIQPVLDRFDHAFICDAGDNLMLTFLLTSGLKFLVVPFQTTAENLVQHLLELLWTEFDSHESLTRMTLRLQETEISYAQASRSR
jgi:6-pyruvoyltetrahydropterin/6-carboxytetrahydropterin synthase